MKNIRVILVIGLCLMTGSAFAWIHGGPLACNTAGFVAGPNLIQSPDNFAGADWSTNNVTTAQAQGTAPDGSNSFNTITDNATNASHLVFQNGLNPNNAGLYTHSAFFKQGTARYGYIQIFDVNTGTGYGTIVDTLAGSLGTPNSIGSPTGTSAIIASCASIVPLPAACGTGIYLVTITMNVGAGTANVYPSIGLSNSATPTFDAAGRPTYVGTGLNILAWNSTFTVPVPIGNVCIPPAPPWVTAGYNLNTFHSPSFSAANVDVSCTATAGFQWYIGAMFGQNPMFGCYGAGLIFNGDGSLTLSGNSPSILAAVANLGTPANWHGQAFGGGAYFEATLSFSPSDVIGGGGAVFPAWWADPIEHAAESSIFSDNWTGQVNGFVHFIETDFFEYNVVGNGNELFQYNGTAIDWSGIFTGGNYPVAIQNSSNRTITLPVGTDLTRPHRYGFLWVPATSLTLGYFQWYFDGLPTSDRVTYSQYNCATPPSPPMTTSTPTLFGAIDCQHPMPIVTTNAYGAPAAIRVYSVDVWQKSAANNIVQ